MNKQKRRIMQLRTIYEGIIDDDPEEHIDRFFTMGFNRIVSV